MIGEVALMHVIARSTGKTLVQHPLFAFTHCVRSKIYYSSVASIAELEAMFYLQRDRVFAEYHERMIGRILKKYTAANDPQAEILHLMEKTNFLRCLQGAAARLGRLSLAERLKVM